MDQRWPTYGSKVGRLLCKGNVDLASRSVRLQDKTEGLSLAADRVVYERSRQLLSIHGLPQRPFRFTQQKPGKVPINVNGERAFYDLATGELEQVSKLSVTR